MLDREDREALLSFGTEWGLKIGAVFLAVIGASVMLGLALRLFEAARG